MKRLNEPPAHVARAEVDAGFKVLANAVLNAWVDQRAAQDRADVHGLEVGRLICEHAERPDIQTRVEIANTKKNGRPKTAPCWLAEEIFKAGQNGPSIRHMERCARAWLKAQKKGLPINTPIRIAEASELILNVSDRCDAEGAQLRPDDMQPSPERLFAPNADADADANASEPFDPERAGASLARKIHAYFYTPEGHPIMRTKAQKNAFMKHVNDSLGTCEIDWEFYPRGGME